MLSRQVARSPFSSMGAFSRRSQLATFCTPAVLEVRPGSIVPRLILPLNNAKYSFPLRSGTLLRQLLQDIRAEAPAIGEIIATDSNGVRLAQTTPISTLMKNGFEMKVDNKKYQVEPASTVAPASTLAVVDVQDLCAKAYFVKIRQRIAADKRDHVTYAEYESWCTEYGLSADQAKSLAQSLHVVGDVLYFSTNPKLKDFLFLHPTYVTGSVADALNINFVKVGHGQDLARLEQLLPEYLELNDKKLQYDKAAEKSADLWMKGSGVYLVVQFLILARMVWIDFNWDIMEPVTYFVTFGGTILGYLFFVLFKVEYTYMALKERQVRKYLRKLYLKNEFKWPRWNELDREAHHLVHELGGANVPKELAGLPNWKKCEDHPKIEAQ